MQKKMRFQINEIGEAETVFWFSDPFSVTGGALLSHPSDTGDNEMTALWTEAGGINKSKFISAAPKARQSSSSGVLRRCAEDACLWSRLAEMDVQSEEEKGDSTLTSEKRTPVLLRCSSS